MVIRTIRTTDKNLIRQFQSQRPRKKRKPPVIRQASYQDGVLYMPIKTVSEPNNRDHWRTKADRSYYQRIAARFYVVSHIWRRPLPLPLRITLTRIGPRSLDSDNLAAALKAVRDGVMDGLGHSSDADSDSLQWVYDQRRGASGEFAVEVKVERLSN